MLPNFLVIVNCIFHCVKILNLIEEANGRMRIESVKNLSVSLSPTLVRNEKVEHYIRIKTHKLIVYKFKFY